MYEYEVTEDKMVRVYCIITNEETGDLEKSLVLWQPNFATKAKAVSFAKSEIVLLEALLDLPSEPVAESPEA
jgi:hypothetical protein